MSGKHHDDPLQELVDIAVTVLGFLDRGDMVYPNTSLHSDLARVTAPFRPSPEEELAKEMHRTYINSLNATHDPDRAMRDVLAVVKERGLPQ